jgi:hypothetical protein
VEGSEKEAGVASPNRMPTCATASHSMAPKQDAMLRNDAMPRYAHLRRLLAQTRRLVAVRSRRALEPYDRR